MDKVKNNNQVFSFKFTSDTLSFSVLSGAVVVVVVVVVVGTTSLAYTVFSSVYDVSLMPHMTIPASGNETSIKHQLAIFSFKNGVDVASIPNEPAPPADCIAL